jgi:hypothetical protein
VWRDSSACASAAENYRRTSTSATWRRASFWTTSTLDIESYLAYWTQPPGLHAGGIFSPSDERQFDADFRETQREQAYPRPAVAVTRLWAEPEAGANRVPSELCAALREVLTALREPSTTGEPAPSAPMSRSGGIVSGKTTRPGYTNRNDQVNVRATGLPGNDYFQCVYVLCCGRCGHEYGANGSDIFQRKCPSCLGGQPGLAY